MSELTDTLREEFKDKETRHVYCDEFLNSSIATQIKVLREQRGLTQRELAERASMRQERISVLEDVNYSSWTINVLRRLAEAFDLTLTVKFESFGEKLFAIEDMNRETLEKPSFDEDPVFQDRPDLEPAIAEANTLSAVRGALGFPSEESLIINAGSTAGEFEVFSRRVMRLPVSVLGISERTTSAESDTQLFLKKSPGTPIPALLDVQELSSHPM